MGTGRGGVGRRGHVCRKHRLRSRRYRRDVVFLTLLGFSTPRGGVRQVSVVEGKRAVPFGRATVTKEHLSGVPVEVVKYSESSYKLAAKGLAPGE